MARNDPNDICEEVFGDNIDSVEVDETTYATADGEVAGIISEEMDYGLSYPA